MEEKFVDINGIKTFTRIGGAGTPFLILHGWGRGHNSWVSIQDDLSKYFKVIILDMPGFGKSDLPQNVWGIQDYSNFMIDFVKKVGINDFYLLGHSFGGSVAIKMATQLHQEIKKMILVDSAGRRPKAGFNKKVLSFVASGLKHFSFIPGYSAFRKIFYRFILRSTDYIKAEGIMKDVFKKVVSEDLSGLWAKINSPTLIVWGKQDKITPIKDAYLMKEKIKDSKLELLDCSHVPQKEAPKDLTRAIINFLSND